MTKPVITTRAGKGSALTWTEGDTNLTNLRDATISVTDGTNTAALDLNDTLSLSAGTGISVSVNASTKTATITNTQSAGATTLDGLSDVNTSGVANNHVLKYNSGSNEWQTTLLDIPTNLDSLTDVTVTTPTDGQVLKYNNSMSRWENGTVTASATPAGSDQQVQFNNSGSFGASSSLTWTGTSLNAPILASTQSAGDEGGQIELALASTNNTLTGSVAIDVNQSQVRIFETGGSNRGAYINLASASAGVGSNLLAPDIVNDTTPQLGGNLDVQANIITTSTTNGNITITPDGTGDVILSTDSVQIGESTNQAVLTTSGGNLRLNTNNGTNSGSITITAGANGAISISPNGTGKTTIYNLAFTESPIYDLGTTGGTISPNIGLNGQIQKITLNSALTMNGFSAPAAGQSLTLIIYGGTAYTSITSTMKFAGGIKTLTGTAGCVDILTVYYDGTNYWASLGKDFK